MAEPDPDTELGRLPLAEESATILRRTRRRRVRVAVTTEASPQTVRTTRRRRLVEVERVPVDREVTAPPPVRQEGDTLVVPVLEERVVLVRRLVLTEEIRLRLRTEEEQVDMQVTLRRQSFGVERLAETTSDIPEPIAGDHFMQRTLTALFDSRAEADRAAEALRGLNVTVSNVQVHDSAGGRDEDGQSWAPIGSMWLPENERATYHEGLRRGGAIVSAEVAETDLELAMDAMEAAGAADLEAREADWRRGGWTGAIAGDTAPEGTPGNPPGTMASRAVDKVAGTNISGARPDNERTARTGPRGGVAGSVLGETAEPATGRETIPLAEEQLRVGKRVAHAGRVRVRSYVVETPVEQQVGLREEHVHIERRPADRPATGEDPFRERVIEAEESIEEPVVQKETRITGEVVVNKETTERTETVRDTVRRTEVDVDPDQAANDPTRRGGKGAA